MKRSRKSTVGQAFALGLAAGVILFAGWGFAQGSRAQRAYTPNNLMKASPDVIPANTIRLHIPANSDDALDQAVKEEVRDALMANFGDELAGIDDAKEAEKILRSALPEIEKVAQTCLWESGISYGVKAAVKTVYFPEKTYELANGQQVCLPQGDYKALQVVLGKGEGKNWWCVMYPPLCYFDLVQRGIIPGVSTASPQSDDVVKGVILVDDSRAEEVRVEVRSLLLDAIRASVNKIGEALSFMAEAGLSRVPTSDME